MSEIKIDLKDRFPIGAPKKQGAVTGSDVTRCCCDENQVSRPADRYSDTLVQKDT